jgi:hypothetical protein
VNLGSIELHTSLHLRDDLHRPTGQLVFEMPAVLERVAAHGDLFAAVLTKRQQLG